MNALNTLSCALKNGLKSEVYVLFVFFFVCVCVTHSKTLAKIRELSENYLCLAPKT